MSKTNGRLLICDRCGLTTFEKAIGEHEMDGGFTKWTKFEHSPDWHTEYSYDLCPACCAEWKALKDSFFCSVKKKEKVDEV